MNNEGAFLDHVLNFLSDCCQSAACASLCDAESLFPGGLPLELIMSDQVKTALRARARARDVCIREIFGSRNVSAVSKRRSPDTAN